MLKTKFTGYANFSTELLRNVYFRSQGGRNKILGLMAVVSVACSLFSMYQNILNNQDWMSLRVSAREKTTGFRGQGFVVDLQGQKC